MRQMYKEPVNVIEPHAGCVTYQIKSYKKRRLQEKLESIVMLRVHFADDGSHWTDIFKW